MPTKVVLVDGVGNGAVHEIQNKVLPVTVTVAGRAFVRTGEHVTELPVYRLQSNTKQTPTIRRVSHYVPTENAA